MYFNLEETHTFFAGNDIPGLNVYLLLQICFCFVIRETSCCLFNADDIIETSNFALIYLDVLLNIDDPKRT